MENFLSNNRDTVLTMTRREHLLSLLAAYFLLLVCNGYIYGHGDMIELLPYAKWLTDSTLYPHDFFIQNITLQNYNERFILAYLFSLVGKAMPLLALLLHMASSLFLLEALFRIAKMFIQSDAIAWAAILIPFAFFLEWNLGGNEMYVPMVVSETIAIAISVWSLYFFLKKSEGNRNEWKAFILLSIAAFFQPLASFQLFLVLAGIRVLIVIFPFLNSEKSGKRNIVSFLPISFYLLTAGIWIYFINSHFSEGELEKSMFFEFLEFRLAHHFLPLYFSKKSAIILLPLFFYGLFFFYKKNQELFLLFVLILLGALIYSIGVEVFEITTIAKSQWFKATMWLKSLSVIALFSFLENRISWLRKRIVTKIGIYALRFVGVISIIIILNPISIFKNKHYEFSFLKQETAFAISNNSKIEIAKIAKEKTPKDAIFIIPSSDTHFKNYSERSTYIDFKAVIHRKHAIPIWYARIQEIYGVNINTRQEGKDIYKTANENFRNLTMEDLKRFSQKGIQYLLTFKEVDLPLKRIGENAGYVIYKLP